MVMVRTARCFGRRRSEEDIVMIRVNCDDRMVKIGHENPYTDESHHENKT